MRSLEFRGYLSTAQCGLRVGRDVVGACRQLVNTITSTSRHREHVQAVTLDLYATYDTIW